MRQNSSPKIAYITSSNRAGSTLLGKILGLHPQICFIGELRNLRGYLKNNRKFFNPVYPLKCSCSKDIQECLFWKAVFAEIDCDINELELNYRFVLGRGRRTAFDKIRRKFEKFFFPNYPECFAGQAVQWFMGYGQISKNCIGLYNAVAKVSAAKVIVDSSKIPLRMNALDKSAPESVRVLDLCRHPFGVIHSMMKHGLSLEQSVTEWVQDYKQHEVFLQKIPPKKIMKIRYEELCANPVTEMQKICDFLSILFNSKNFTGTLEKEMHCIGGSPSQFTFNPERIKDKKEYLTGLSDDNKKIIQQKIGKLSESMGYSL